MEFPHLLRLLERNQFDTIYHEHYSYLSLISVTQIFAQHGLKIFDVQELESHGGSIRIFATHSDNQNHAVQPSVQAMLEDEQAAQLNSLIGYQDFRTRVEALKFSILGFLLDAKRQGKSVAGYGAPGKGVTLLNYCGIRNDLIRYTVDRNAYKQRTFVPGTGIPVYAPEHLQADEPDYVFILPWNLESEIISQVDASRWGGKYIIPIPNLTVQ